jgi:Bacterial Ig-like domain (group 3)
VGWILELDEHRRPAGLMSGAAFNNLLDAAAAFPVARSAPQPAGAAPASSASPAVANAAPAPFSSAAPLAAPVTVAPATDGSANSSPSPPQIPSRQANISLSSNLSQATQGQLVTFTATVGTPGGVPSGTVTFWDGSNQLSIPPVRLTPRDGNSSQAMFPTSLQTVGFHSITAVYSGDVNFGGATSNAVSLNVSPGQPQSATRTTLTSSVNPSLTNTGVTTTAHVVGLLGDTPAGKVTFTFGNRTYTTGLSTYAPGDGFAFFPYLFLAAGNYPITAVYNPDPGTPFITSSTELTQTVRDEPTTTTLTSDFNPSYPNTGVTFRAFVNGLFGDAPTGSVDFYNGNTLLATQPLMPGGPTYQYAAIWYSFAALGSYTITAVYIPAANTPFTTSYTRLTQIVQKPTTITYLTSSVSPSYTGQGVTFTALVLNQARFQAPGEEKS